MPTYTGQHERVRGALCSAGHAIAELGLSKRGLCRRCLQLYRAERHRRRGGRNYDGTGPCAIVRGPVCPRGHVIAEVGLDSAGHCRPCQSAYQKIKAREWHARRRARLAGRCARGHHLVEAGTDAKGRCLSCIARRRKYICPKGHDKRLVGRGPRGHCMECLRARSFVENQRRRARLQRVPVEEFDRLALRRAAATCGICLKPLGRSAVEVDHVIPVARGGADAPWNMMPTHRRCNARKHCKLLRHERRGDGWVAVLYDETGEMLWDGERIVERRVLRAPVAWVRTAASEAA